MEDNLSVNTQGVAEPVDNIETTNTETTEVNPVVESENNVEVTDPQQQEKIVQTEEANRAFAEIRRQAQQYQRELQQRDEWVRNTFGRYGVNTWQDYQLKMEEQLRATREAELKQQGYDPRAIREIMKNDPEYQQVIQQNQLLQQQIQQQSEQQRLLDEFSTLKNEFPEVKNPEDIPKEVWQKFNQGYSLTDAYFVVNRDKIRQKTEQETIKKLQSNSNKSPGALGNESSDHNTKISNMSSKDFKDLVEKVKRGEITNL